MSARERRLTIQEAARRLGLHEQTVRKYVKRGLIRTLKTPSVSKFGHRHRILESDLQKFVARHLQGPDRIEAPRIVGPEKSGNGKLKPPRNPDERSGDEHLF